MRLPFSCATSSIGRYRASRGLLQLGLLQLFDSDRPEEAKEYLTPEGTPLSRQLPPEAAGALQAPASWTTLPPTTVKRV